MAKIKKVPLQRIEKARRLYYYSFRAEKPALHPVIDCFHDRHNDGSSCFAHNIPGIQSFLSNEMSRAHYVATFGRDNAIQIYDWKGGHDAS